MKQKGNKQMHATMLVILDKEYTYGELYDVLQPFEFSNDPAFFTEFSDETEYYREKYDKLIEDKKISCSFAEYCEGEGLQEHEEEPGKFGYYSNPCGFYDWYVVGGRWSNYLKLKDEIKYAKDIVIGEDDDFEGWEKHCSAARKIDLDFELMREEKLKAIEKLYEEFEEKVKNNKELITSAFIGDIHYFKDKGRYETKEEYLSRKKESGLFYSILKGGVLYSQDDNIFDDGKIKTQNWNEIEKYLIDECDENQFCVLIDYHY